MYELAATPAELREILSRAAFDVPDTAECDALATAVIEMNARVVDRRDAADYCGRSGETLGVIQALQASVELLEAERDNAVRALINRSRYRSAGVQLS